MSHDEHDAVRGANPSQPLVDEHGRPIQQTPAAPQEIQQQYYDPAAQPAAETPQDVYQPDFAPYDPQQVAEQQPAADPYTQPVYETQPVQYEQPQYVHPQGEPTYEQPSYTQPQPNHEQYWTDPNTVQYQQPAYSDPNQPDQGQVPQPEPDPYAFNPIGQAHADQAPTTHDPYAAVPATDYSATDDLGLHPEQAALASGYDAAEFQPNTPQSQVYHDDFTGQPSFADYPATQTSTGYGQEPAADQPYQPTNFGTADAQYREPAFSDPTAEIPHPAAITPEKSTSKGLLAVIALVTAAGVGGGSAFVYKTIYGDASAANGKPPVIMSDKRPVKVKPTRPGGLKFANGEKKVYDRIGKPKVQPVRQVAPQGSAASRVQFAGKAPDTASAPANIPGVSIGGIPGISLGGVTQPPRAEPTAAQVARQLANAKPTAGALPPGGVRKVPTVTIMPDGSLAPPSPLAKTPSAPTRTASLSKPSGLTRPAGGGSSQSANRKNAVAAPAARPTPSRPAPVIRATPSRRPAAAPTRTASIAPSSGGRLGYVAQISARKSRIDALAAFADLQQRYPRVLNGKTPDIQTANLGSRGTWYRVRVGPPGSKGATSKLCSSLKKAGLGSCLVRAY